MLAILARGHHEARIDDAAAQEILTFFLGDA